MDLRFIKKQDLKMTLCIYIHICIVQVTSHYAENLFKIDVGRRLIVIPQTVLKVLKIWSQG